MEWRIGERNDGNAGNQGGNAGNQSGNAGNQGRNVGNQGENLLRGVELMNYNCGEGQETVFLIIV